jgi:hypothetical protein
VWSDGIGIVGFRRGFCAPVVFVEHGGGKAEDFERDGWGEKMVM